MLWMSLHLHIGCCSTDSLNRNQTSLGKPSKLYGLWLKVICCTLMAIILYCYFVYISFLELNLPFLMKFVLNFYYFLLQSPHKFIDTSYIDLYVMQNQKKSPRTMIPLIALLETCGTWADPSNIWHFNTNYFANVHLSWPLNAHRVKASELHIFSLHQMFLFNYATYAWNAWHVCVLCTGSAVQS